MSRLFNGGYLNCGDITQTDGLSGMTYAGWFKRTSGSQRIPFGKYSSSTSDFAINVHSSTLVYVTMRNGGNTYCYFTNNSTTWNRILVVFDGSLVGTARLKVWVNGASQSVTYVGTPPATTPANAADFEIGKYAGTVGDGQISDVKIWSAVLSASEIMADYRTSMIPQRESLIFWMPIGYGSPEPEYSGSASNGSLVSAPPLRDPPGVPPFFGYDDAYSYLAAESGPPVGTLNLLGAGV